MKTKAGRFVKKIAAAVLVFTMACPYAYAADIGKVTYVEGRVDVSKSGSEVATPLREGDGIAIGDSIRTKSNSKAEITFNDNSALRLAQNTKVEVRDYVLDEKNQRKTAEVMVDRGKARTIISKMPGLTEFNISTPNAKGTVHGSDVYTTFQAGSSNMLVADGQLSVTNPSIPKEVLIVPAGNSVVVPQNEAPKGPRAYFDLEKKMSENDTSIPDMASRKPTSTVIKGAIAKLSGDVKITLKSTGQTRKATINDIIEEGDSIETGANGVVELKFDNGNGLNLKPGTKVTVTKLAQDPKTGQYENKFESSMGKVRARIEKVRETKSTFEVRTPTAICGARGTLMYIEIGPRATRCFFEGGFGDLASAISSMHREIEMGHAAYSDNDGNIYDPYIPGDEERLDWTSNWDPGNGTEGYVSPGGTIGLGLNAGAITNVVLNPETELQSYFSDPLFPVTPVSTITEEIPTSSGSFHADSSYYGNGNGMMDGIVSLFDYLWNGGTATIESAGTYENYGYSPFVWFGEYNYEQYAIVEGATVNEGFLYSYNPDTQMYTTYDDGAFYGNAVGIGGGGIMDGIVRFLYIDPSGNAGIAKGLVEGLYGLGAYIMVGVLTGEQRAADIGIAAEDLYNSIFTTDYADGTLYGAANSGGASAGTISGNDRFNTFSIVNRDTGEVQNWGIYQHIFSGSSYSGDLSSGWTGYVGGNDAIGAYFRPYEDGREMRALVSKDGGANGYFYQDSGYWLMSISDGTWSDSNFTASASGYFITMTKIGTISGDLIGVYNDEGSWQGAGMGEWQGTPLKFASQVYDSMYYPQVSAPTGDTQFENEYLSASRQHNGHMSGILGGTDSLWSGAEAAAVFMGRYSDCSNYNTTKGAWTSYIQTENRINGGYTDYDGGAYSGLFTSAHLGSRAIGVLKVFYVDPDGAAGILSGDFTGTHYPGINMVRLDGTITRDERFPDGIGIDPQDLHNNVSEGGGGGTLISNSSNDWIIRADEALDTMSLVDYDNGVAADWGIYAQNFTGYYNGAVPQGWSAVMGGNDSFGITDPYDYGEYSNYSYNDGQYYYLNKWRSYQSDSGYWIADISDGTWAGGDLSANLNGRYISRTRLGTMSGIIRGIYDEFGNNGSWVGVGAGEWEGQDLSWVSNLGVSRNYYFGNYNNALMGSIEDLWSGTPSIVGMGNVNNYSSTYRIWGSDNVYTHDYNKGTDTAYSGGAFYGLLRGIVLDDESLNGLFRAIYVDQSGNGGVMKGFIDDGAMYQDLGMFEFSGAITDRIQKISAELLGIAPEDLIDYVKLGNNESGNLYAVSEDGSYISGSDTFRTMSIADYDQNVAQNWGIYGQTLSGSYGLALLSEAVYGDGGELITPAIYGNLNSWSGHMGGNDSFGVYNPTKQYDGYAYGTDSGYWVATVETDPEWTGENTFHAGLNGRFLTYTKTGTLSGEILGRYLGDGTWQGVGAGDWEGTALSHVAAIDVDHDRLTYEYIPHSWWYGYAYNYYWDWVHHYTYIDALIGGVDTLWSGDPNITIMGQIYGEKPYPFVWQDKDVYSHNYLLDNGYSNRANTTYDGGSYSGNLIGSFAGNAAKAVFAALYIDPSGNAGAFLVNLAGTIYKNISSYDYFEMDSTSFYRSENSYATDILPGNLRGNLYTASEGEGTLSGAFVGEDGPSGYINGSDTLVTTTLASEDLGIAIPVGIYHQEISGSLYDPEGAGDFEAMMGGNDPIGAYLSRYTYEDEFGQTVEEFDLKDDWGYWMADIDGALNSDGTIEADLDGKFITHTKLGDIFGKILGIYSGSSWNGKGVGIWTGNALKFVSDVTLNFVGGGSYNAILGGTDSIWDNGSIITVMGSGATELTDPVIWESGPVVSHDYIHDTNTTYDGGAYSGVMAGVRTANAIRGLFGAIYVDNDGNGGIVASSLSGQNYSELGMFDMYGNVQQSPMGEVSISPSGFNIISGSCGLIFDWDMFSTARIYDIASDTAYNWGLYSQRISGSYDGLGEISTVVGNSNFASRPTNLVFDTGYWLANLTGSVDNDGVLAANLTDGRFITHYEAGTLLGKVLGVVSSGSWTGIGLGEWDSQSLSYLSDVQTQVKSFSVKATTTRYDVSYHIYGNNGPSTDKLTRELTYFYYNDNSSGYSKNVYYKYDGQGNQSIDTGGGKQNYERTYYANGTWTGTIYKKVGNVWGWYSDSGTWTGTLQATIETSLPTPDSNDVFTSSQTGGWALSITNTGANFITGLAGSIDDIIWGQTSQTTIMGTVSSSFAAGNVWSADIKSHNYINGTDTTYDGGAYMGYLLGAKPGTPDGLFVALYVDPSQKGGYLLGKISGELYPGLGMFEATGDILATKMSDNVGILPVDLTALGSTSSDTMTWQGSGKFAQGGSLVTMASGQTLQINNQDWGIWTAFMGGNYTYPTGGITSQNWSTALSGESASGAHVIGTASGNIWADHKVEGAFNGIYIMPGQIAGSASIGKVEGLVDGGYIEVDTVNGTWNAASAGEWVEVSDLLNQTKMFGANGIAELNKFVNVPVTEVYRNLLTSTACAGGITSATMNLNLYALDPNVLSGIWTALINGGYSGTVNPTGWSATVSGNGGATNVTVAGTQWANNQWVANVTGTVNVNGSAVNITNGQAGGTYTNPDVNGAGTFTGAGAGTYQAP